MSLFDELERAAGLGGSGSGPAPAGVVGAVTQLVQSYPGGIGGMVQAFERAGLGGVAQSWTGTGQNQAVSGAQIHSVLGSGLVEQVAAQVGVAPDQAAGHIAQFLPLILDHLTPGGQVPAGSGLAEIEGLLSRFLTPQAPPA
jgi:uncharacterized protein YidB (DUF937 family)